MPHEPDYVVNFIAQSMVAESWSTPLDWFQTNVMAQVSVHEFLRRYFPSMKRYVHISTPEVYGSTGAALDESAAFNPTTPYAVSRAACDMWLMALHRAYGFPVVFTRTVNVYGPGQQLYRIAPKTIMSILGGTKLQLHGGGESTRSFINVYDMAAATYLTATQGRAGEVYHSSTARQTRIVDLVTMICEMMGARFSDVVEFVPDRLGKDMNYQLDSGKLRAETGWTDTVRLESGLQETIDWAVANYDTLKTQPQEYRHRP